MTKESIKFAAITKARAARGFDDPFSPFPLSMQKELRKLTEAGKAGMYYEPQHNGIDAATGPLEEERTRRELFAKGEEYLLEYLPKPDRYGY